MYHDPACSLKLNTEIIANDTSRCISTDTHDMHSERDFRGRSDSWFTCMLCFIERKTTKLIPLKKKSQITVLMAHYQSGFQALSIFQEKTKRHTTIHEGKDVLNMEVDGFQI